MESYFICGNIYLMTNNFHIKRYYDILKYHKKGKVLIIYGPRRVGKTTLVKDFFTKGSSEFIFINGDESEPSRIFESGSLADIKKYINSQMPRVLNNSNSILPIFIDEAQNISNIGKSLKMLIDDNPNLQIIATGSSFFSLAGQIGEPLTGRKTQLMLYPISILELSNNGWSDYSIYKNLVDYLTYGMYPEILATSDDTEKIELLNELTESYLYKDILAFERIKNSNTLKTLLQLLALQIGSEVSYNELATTLKIDVKTVQRYINLLEESFVIFPLYGLSRNMRNEIKNKNKYYFYDLGIRNSIIKNFNNFDLRNDFGAVFENFFIAERKKTKDYLKIIDNEYFWRNYNQKEVDYIEEIGGKFFAYEIKSSARSSYRFPKDFLENYNPSSKNIITKENFCDFLLS